MKNLISALGKRGLSSKHAWHTLKDRSARRQRISEYVKRAKRYFISFRSHILRTIATEDTKSKIIEEFENGDALVTADFCMKQLPTSAVYVLVKPMFALIGFLQRVATFVVWEKWPQHARIPRSG